MLSGDHIMRQIAVEGLCRLVIKYEKEPFVPFYVAFLLIVWFDSKQAVEPETTQTLTLFFSNYLFQSLSRTFLVVKAMVFVFYLQNELSKHNTVFHPSIRLQMDYTNLLKYGTSFFVYSDHKEKAYLKELESLRQEVSFKECLVNSRFE